MPKRHPPEFNRDVVDVARMSGLTHAQVATGFGIPAQAVQRCLKQAITDDAVVEDTTSGGQDELVRFKCPSRAQIVGYAIGPRMISQLADAALHTVIGRRGPTCTFVVTRILAASRRCQRTLRAHGLIASMGCVSSGRGSRRDGVLLRAAGAHRPRPTALGVPRRVAPGDHHLDRADLPPPTPVTRTEQAHPRQIRSHHQLQPPRRSSMTRRTTVNRRLSAYPTGEDGENGRGDIGARRRLESPGGCHRRWRPSVAVLVHSWLPPGAKPYRRRRNLGHCHD